MRLRTLLLALLLLLPLAPAARADPVDEAIADANATTTDTIVLGTRLALVGVNLTNDAIDASLAVSGAGVDGSVRLLNAGVTLVVDLLRLQPEPAARRFVGEGSTALLHTAARSSGAASAFGGEALGSASEARGHAEGYANATAQRWP